MVKPILNFYINEGREGLEILMKGDGSGIYSVDGNIFKSNKFSCRKMYFK